MPEMNDNERRETFARDLKRLYEKNHRRLFQKAYSITRNREDAYDVVQTIFVKLFETQTTIDVLRNPEGYLSYSTTNEAIDVRNAREKHKGDDSVDMLEIIAPEPDSGEQDDFDFLLTVIAKMKPDFLETLILFYKDGYKGWDIAGIRGRPLITVYSDLRRARAELKRLIREEEKSHGTQKAKHATNHR